MISTKTQAYNFHSHTNYSDGQAEPRKFVESAIQKGFQAYGFTDHAPVNFPCNWTMPLAKLPGYLQEIRDLQAEYRGEIDLYCGLEVDYIPEVVSIEHDYIRQLPLDYTVGSVHFVDQFSDHTPWGFEESRKVFRHGVEQIFNGNAEQAVKRYYQLVREMIKTRPAIIGHLDRIKIHNQGQAFFSEQALWYQEEVEKTLHTILAEGVIMEVNTKGLFPGDDQEPYPSFWIIERAIALGIPLILSSDAHHPLDVDRSFPAVLAKLQQLGLQELSFFHSGQWVPRSF